MNRTLRKKSFLPAFLLIGMLLFWPAGLVAQHITSGLDGYRTLTTDHFRIHYPEGRNQEARRLARFAERFHETNNPRYRSDVENTDVVLVFDNDTVNAFATVFSRDLVVLFLTNPPFGPMGSSGWSRYGNWMEELFAHEYTHIQTIRVMDTAWSWLFRGIVGLPPNIIAPLGMAEGVAVYEESRHGTGRNNDSLTRMTVRAALLEDALPDTAEVMNGSHRWPFGSLYYLYGGLFHRILADRLGERGLLQYWHENEDSIFFDTRLEDSGLRDYPQMYDYMVRVLKKEVEEDQSRFEGEDRTTVKMITEDGGIKKWLSVDDRGELFYFANNLRRPPGIFRLDSDPGKSPESGTGEPEVYRSVESSRGIATGGGRVLTSEDYYSYPEFGVRQELYDGEAPVFFGRMNPDHRITDPSLSNDGRILYYVEREKGQKVLRRAIADPNGEFHLEESPGELLFRVPEGGILQQTDSDSTGERVLFLARSGLRGRASLYECGTRGVVREGEKKDKKRDSGREDSLCHLLLESDAAILQPSYDLDGSRIYFSSDIDGRFEIYSWERESGTLLRKSRTDTGLFEPTPVTGGLYALQFGARGYDLVYIAGENLKSTPAALPPPTEAEPSARMVYDDTTPLEGEGSWKDDSYEGPLAMEPSILGLANMGITANESFFHLGLLAQDPLNRHYFVAAAGETNGHPEIFAGYDYSRYSVGFAMTYYTNYTPGARDEPCYYKPEYYLGGRYFNLCPEEIPFREQGAGIVYYRGRNRFFSYRMTGGVTHEKLRNAHKLKYIEYQARDINRSGPTASLELGNYYTFPESVSPEYGWYFNISGSYYPEELSWFSLREGDRTPLEYGVVQAEAGLYLPSFFDHHVQSLHVEGITTAGRDRAIQLISQAALMKGIYYDYAPRGTAGAVATYEYRMPLYWFSGAPFESYPEFMIREAALSVFAQYGAIGGKKITRHYGNASYGAALHFGFSFYHVPVPVQLTLQIARGTGEAAENQYFVYFTAGSIPPLEESPVGSGMRGDFLQGSPLVERFFNRKESLTESGFDRRRNRLNDPFGLSAMHY